MSRTRKFNICMYNNELAKVRKAQISCKHIHCPAPSLLAVRTLPTYT